MSIYYLKKMKNGCEMNLLLDFVHKNVIIMKI